MLFSPSLMLFLLMIAFSLVFVLSSPSLILCWVGLEINTLAFIPLLLNENSKGLSDSSIKYFLTQALASVLFLLSLVISPVFGQLDQPLILLVVVALLVKLGAAPFHAWVPSIVESLSWFILFFLLTIQKLNPLFILLSLNFLDSYKSLIFLSVTCSVLVGSILGVVQVRVRKIMTFSSINHMGWILVAFLMGVKLTFIYFFTYMILLSAIISVFSEFNLQHINQIISSPIFGVWAPLLFLNLLSLGGLPPFLGFLPKWLLLQEMIFSNFFVLSLVMILSSLIVLYFYLRLTFSAFMLKKLNWFSKPEVSLTGSMIFLNIISMGGLTLSFLI